jgi:hypothetical protein
MEEFSVRTDGVEVGMEETTVHTEGVTQCTVEIIVIIF